MKNSLQSLLVVVLAGVAFNAHALCVNSDGSLDDASVSEETIAVDILPDCEYPKAKAAGAPKPGAVTGKQNNPEPAQPAEKIKGSRLKLDIQAANLAQSERQRIQPTPS